MALNIKNIEVEKLAAEAARLSRESKTQVIRQALQEHIRRLKVRRGGQGNEDQVDAILARFRKEFPKGDFGRRMTKVERERILGYGPDGV